VSDELTPDAEQSDATEPSSPPPWGEDFNPERAWNTISHLRSFEDDAKTFRKLKEDPEARNDFLRGLGYEVEDPDAPEAEATPEWEAEEDPIAREVAELREWRDQQVQAQEKAEVQNLWVGWESYIKEQAKEAGVELSKRDIKALRVDCTANNGRPIPADKASGIFKEYAGVYFAEPAPPRPNAPHVLKSGKAATGVPNYDEMPHDAQNEAMAERIKALQS
jgi:hypothetical protein